MKVQIKEVRSGKVKFVEKRFAEIMVKSKFASYYQEPEVRVTYETKIMNPELPQEPLNTPLENPDENINNDEKPKRRGRRKNTYETKVMTAEE